MLRLYSCSFLLFSAALGCCCLHVILVKLYFTQGVPCWLIRPCSAAVLVTVPLLLLCSVKLYALYACISLRFLLRISLSVPQAAVARVQLA